jgi:hypothetical protein
MVSFTHNNTDKTQKLSLVNYILHKTGTDGTDTKIGSDLNNHLCTVHLLKYHIENKLPWYWSGLWFLKKATVEVLSLCQSLGILYIVDTNPSFITDSTPWGKVVCSFLTSQVPKLAICCNFENALKFTGRRARRGRILKMDICGVLLAGKSLVILDTHPYVLLLSTRHVIQKQRTTKTVAFLTHQNNNQSK